MNISELIKQLEQDGKYKVIEKLIAPERYHEGTAQTPRIGIVIDTETTGLDTTRDKVIELGFVAFSYDAASGYIFEVLHRYDGFEDPCEPLTADIIKITGITDAMVKDQKLDDEEIVHWLNQADLIIAHNAAFDRAVLERRLPMVKEKNWACTLTNIAWKDEDIGSLKLDYIAFKLGFFFDGHRALNDAEATLHLLSKTLPVSAKPALFELLANARINSRRYFATSAPFEKKDVLKARGYRWLADLAYTDNLNKQKKGVWSIVVDEDASEAEASWLNETVYAGSKATFASIAITAGNRFSTREFAL